MAKGATINYESSLKFGGRPSRTIGLWAIKARALIGQQRPGPHEDELGSSAAWPGTYIHGIMFPPCKLGPCHLSCIWYWVQNHRHHTRTNTTSPLDTQPYRRPSPSSSCLNIISQTLQTASARASRSLWFCESTSRQTHDAHHRRRLPLFRRPGLSPSVAARACAKTVFYHQSPDDLADLPWDTRADKSHPHPDADRG